MGEWQPIETAPKDGSEIIVCGGIYGCEYMPLEFHNAKLKESVAAYFDKENNQWQQSIDCCSESPRYLLPTLWMHMPKPQL